MLPSKYLAKMKKKGEIDWRSPQISIPMELDAGKEGVDVGTSMKPPGIRVDAGTSMDNDAATLVRPKMKEVGTVYDHRMGRRNMGTSVWPHDFDMLTQTDPAMFDTQGQGTQTMENQTVKTSPMQQLPPSPNLRPSNSRHVSRPWTELGAKPKMRKKVKDEHPMTWQEPPTTYFPPPPPPPPQPLQTIPNHDRDSVEASAAADDANAADADAAAAAAVAAYENGAFGAEQEFEREFEREGVKPEYWLTEDDALGSKKSIFEEPMPPPAPMLRQQRREIIGDDEPMPSQPPPMQQQQSGWRQQPRQREFATDDDDEEDEDVYYDADPDQFVVASPQVDAGIAESLERFKTGKWRAFHPSNAESLERFPTGKWRESFQPSKGLPPDPPERKESIPYRNKWMRVKSRSELQDIGGVSRRKLRRGKVRRSNTLSALRQRQMLQREVGESLPKPVKMLSKRQQHPPPVVTIVATRRASKRGAVADVEEGEHKPPRKWHRKKPTANFFPNHYEFERAGIKRKKSMKRLAKVENIKKPKKSKRKNILKRRRYETSQKDGYDAADEDDDLWP